MPALAFEMPDYARVTREQRASTLSTFTRWLQLKKYQYEVTFSLYMLTPTEKFIFNSVLFILISLLVTAASLYLPNHVAVIYNRIWYYLHGEFANITAGAADKSLYATDGLGITPEAFGSVAPSAQTVVESVRATLKEL